jgi:hypothetical protein
MFTGKKDASAAGTVYLHKIDFEKIEKYTSKKYSRSLGIFGDLLFFFW